MHIAVSLEFIIFLICLLKAIQYLLTIQKEGEGKCVRITSHCQGE